MPKKPKELVEFLDDAFPSVRESAERSRRLGIPVDKLTDADEPPAIPGWVEGLSGTDDGALWKEYSNSLGTETLRAYVDGRFRLTLHRVPLQNRISTVSYSGDPVITGDSLTDFLVHMGEGLQLSDLYFESLANQSVKVPVVMPEEPVEPVDPRTVLLEKLGQQWGFSNVPTERLPYKLAEAYGVKTRDDKDSSEYDWSDMAAKVLEAAFPDEPIPE